MKLKEHQNLAIRAKVMEYLSVIELETLSNLTFDGTKTSNKLSSVLSTSKEEPEKGPKIINFTDGSAKTITEKHIEKLIKQKRISRDEAKRIFKCKFCQIDDHFEVDCRKKKSASKDNSND